MCMRAALQAAPHVAGLARARMGTERRLRASADPVDASLDGVGLGAVTSILRPARNALTWSGRWSTVCALAVKHRPRRRRCPVVTRIALDRADHRQVQSRQPCSASRITGDVVMRSGKSIPASCFQRFRPVCAEWQMIDQARTQPEVEYAEPDYLCRRSADRAVEEVSRIVVYWSQQYRMWRL